MSRSGILSSDEFLTDIADTLRLHQQQRTETLFTYRIHGAVVATKVALIGYTVYSLFSHTHHSPYSRTSVPLFIYLFKIKAKGQYWPLTCNTNHDTMFDMQEISIKTNSNMYKPN